MATGMRIIKNILIGASLVIVSGCATVEEKQDVSSPVSAYTDDVFRLSSSADLAYQENRWIDAVRLYQELTQAVPEDAYGWFRLGNTFAQQGAYSKAIDAYEASIDRNSSQPKPWFNLSTAYLLNAQFAMTRAWEKLRHGDPAKAVIETRLRVLSDLIHDRIEDIQPATKTRHY